MCQRVYVSVGDFISIIGTFHSLCSELVQTQRLCDDSNVSVCVCVGSGRAHVCLRAWVRVVAAAFGGMGVGGGGIMPVPMG